MINNLRKIRKEQKITLKQLSEKTGISIGYLSHLEKGTRKNPTLSSMSTIAKAIGKKVEDIFETM